MTLNQIINARANAVNAWHDRCLTDSKCILRVGWFVWPELSMLLRFAPLRHDWPKRPRLLGIPTLIVRL